MNINIDWPIVESIASRLMTQAEGAQALLDLVKEARSVEIQLRESDARLATVRENLAVAVEALAGATEAKVLTEAATRRLREEASRLQVDTARRKAALDAEFAEYERAERARLEDSLAEIRANDTVEAERLREVLAGLEERVRAAEVHLAALKGV